MSLQYESFSEEIEEKNQRFGAVLFKISNAVLVFFLEKGSNLKLGTLAVAMPQFGERTCISSILLGERNMTVTMVLAEYIANAYKGISLVSTHLSEILETEASSTLLKLAGRLLDKAGLK